MRILFVTPRFPYPPVKGDQLRAFHQLRLLSRVHKVTLLAYPYQGVAPEDYETVARMCARVVIVKRGRMQGLLGLARAPFTSYPLQTLLYLSQHMKNAVQRELSDGKYDLIHVQLVRMAPFFENSQHIPRVMDLVDCLSLNMKRRAPLEKPWVRWVVWLESRRLAHYEARITRQFDQVMVVSELDRDHLGGRANVHVNPNGVDVNHFANAETEKSRRTLIFTGSMDYFPNVDAVRYFVREILPGVQARIAGVRFQIVGTDPKPSVRALAQHPGVEVTGRVRDIAPYLANADIAVCPIRVASGMQNKVLEAMAAGTPVVASPMAVGSLAVTSGEHLLVAKDTAEFVDLIVELLQNRALWECLRERARHMVRHRYSWEASVNQLEKIYERALARRELQSVR